jgi:pyruvate/2-oxoglutarate dehydrogenase complex dihydrolipoamide acyltransferase (E2) component
MAWYSGFGHPLQNFFWTWGNEKAHSGIDLPDSCGTPLTAILPGKVIIAGQYPCYGGQVSIQSTFAGQPIVYTYLHGQSHNVKVGDTVHPGQLIGYSGAPVAAACGGGCHVHFEVEHGTQAPYTGGPPQNSSASNYPIDPLPLLSYAALGKISAGGTPASSTTSLSDSLSSKNATSLADSLSSKSGTCTPPTTVNPKDWIAYFACQTLGSFGTLAATIGPWLDPIRIAKLVVGVLLVSIGLLVLIIPVTAPIGAAVAATALGAPELAPAAASAAHSLTHRGPKAPPPSPSQAVPAAIGAAGQSAQRRTVQRSYTTRNLGGQASAQHSYTPRGLGKDYGPPPQTGPSAPAPSSAPSSAPLVIPNVLGPGFKPNPNYVPPVPRAPATPRNLGPGRLGTPANPTSREEIAAIQANKMQRGPKTGLTVPYTPPPTPAKRVNARYGARTVMTRTDIPDENVDRMRAFIHSGEPINFTGIPPGEQGRAQVRKRVNRQTARAQSRMTEDELMQIPLEQRTKQTVKRLAEYERLQRRTAFTPIDETLRRLRGEE